MNPAYSCSVTLQLVGTGSWTEVAAFLCYDAADPYAVAICFGDGAGTPDDSGVVWLLGRELLSSGLERPSGDGDVRIWPAQSAPDVLFLHLRAPSGEALFELSRGTVAAFLRRTEAIVPVGLEGPLLGLDDELQILLANGGADPSAR
jgi:hypothetical protein